MKHLLSLLVVVVCGAFVGGCGSTSNLKPTAGVDLKSFQQYTTVSVRDFTDKTGTITDQTKEELQAQCKRFADLIATELVQTQAFDKVVRTNISQPGCLLVTGEITDCTEGSAGLRLWFGCGAGSSYFNANVDVSDAAKAAKLGQIVVDVNSWPLGGWIAAGQTIDVHMRGAAKTIAEQIAKAKAGSVAN